MLELILKILGTIFLLKITLLAILELIEEVLPRIRRIVIKLVKLYVEAKELLGKPKLAKRKRSRNGKSEDSTHQARQVA